MRTQTDDYMIKLALDTIDLEILRWVLDEATSKNPVDRQQYYQLARRPAGPSNMTVVLQ